jgi:hypothetical protein
MSPTPWLQASDFHLFRTPTSTQLAAQMDRRNDRGPNETKSSRSVRGDMSARPKCTATNATRNYFIIPCFFRTMFQPSLGSSSPARLERR